MTTKLYVARCERCGSSAAGASLKRWFLICAALGVLAGLPR